MSFYPKQYPCYAYNQLFNRPDAPSAIQNTDANLPMMPMPVPMPVPMPMPMPQKPNPVDIIPETIASPMYTQGYLKKHIGQKVLVDFLIGTNMLVDKSGTLVDVGTSFIVLKETETDDLILCDMYSIKFVKFYY